MTRIVIRTTLRGRPVELDVFVAPPDESVGIMGYGFEDEVITDAETREKLDWELTDDEAMDIGEIVQDEAVSGFDNTL